MRRFTAAACAFMLPFLFAAPPQDIQFSFRLPREIQFAADGTSDYVIVRPEGCSFEVTAAASRLERVVKEKTGAELRIITDKTDRYAAGAKKPHEILIGNTSRGISSELFDELLYRDYAVRVDGDDLVIAAGNDDGYAIAVKYITDTLLNDGKLCLDDTFEYICRADYEFPTLSLLGSDISEYTVVYQNSTAEGLARQFADEVCERSGRLLSVSSDAGETEKAIVFGNMLPANTNEYKLACENGNIYISAPTAVGLNAADEVFRQTVFDQERGSGALDSESLTMNGTIKPTNEYASYINARTPLQNTRSRLMNDQSLRVAYYGGSVTVGHSATDINRYSWRALTTQWLAQNFPAAEVTEINAAIGATGSHLGAFRVERDIIAQKPDLLFVEFAINDVYNGESSQSAAENYEAIVRRVRKALPNCDIVTVYVVDSGTASSIGLFTQARAHDGVAEAYGIPALSIGKAVVEKNGLKNNSSPGWSTYFNDIVHPTNEGHAAYAKVIAEYLANELLFAEGTPAVAPHPLPDVLNAGAERTLHYVLADESMLENAKGYTFKKDTFVSLPLTPYEGYLYTNTAGNSLEVTFTGTELALFVTTFTSGSIRYTVDGSITGTVTRNSMNNPFPIVKGLSDGEHKIQLEITFGSTKEAWIGAFLSR